DSGNFLGCLLVLRNGLEELAKEPLPNSSWHAGLADVVDLASEAFWSLELPGDITEPEVVRDLGNLLRELERQVQETLTDMRSWDEWLQRLQRRANGLTEQVRRFAAVIHEPPENLQHWAECFASQVAERRDELAVLVPWLPDLSASSA